MFLNQFGQVILRNESTNINIEKIKNSSTLLVCHTKSLDFIQIPENWFGIIYSSQEILDNLKEQYPQIKNQIVLKANTPHEITLSERRKMDLIMIPWESTKEENVMFLLKDKCATTLITDITPKNKLEAFIINKELRDSLKKGIDVLYINDGIYTNEIPSTTNTNTLFPTELMLRALVTIVQPCFVYGLYGTELPDFIQMACKQLDCYD